MQFSIRNLYYVAWFQRDHVESLRSGVEPFILCWVFECGHFQIAVIAALTVNLRLCNTIWPVAFFHVLVKGPYGFLVL
jgi:heme/copper-type cytochrome/quinol oxidase subunit 1